jgi:hypothetical protein
VIGKGKSISHTSASIAYGWNQEKDAEIVLQRHLVGENPREISQEFQHVQQINTHCQKNTLSFVISPTIEDGQRLKVKDLKKITKNFIDKMKLNDRQAIAFVHRDKNHTHIHLYVNRVDFKGVAYNDSFIGKRSQLAAEKVAEKLRLKTVKQVQFEKNFHTKELRTEIKKLHELTMKHQKPANYQQYIDNMKSNGVNVVPSINKQGQLQGFRFHFKEHSFKGSEINRNMSMTGIGKAIVQQKPLNKLISPNNTVKLLGKLVPVPHKLALTITKKVIKKSIQIGMSI